MNTKKCLVLLFSAMLTLTALAEGNLGAHNFIIWANGGVTNYVGSIPNATSQLGGGGGLGLGYEWRDQIFLLQTGLGFRYAQSGFKCDYMVYEVPQCTDSEGDALTYQYLERGRKDQYTQLTAQIPLLVGAHFSYFYFLGGAKINIDVMRKAEVKANYATQGVYDILIDPLANMNNHQFYTNVPLSTTNKSSLKANIAASLEIGAEFNLGETRSGDTFMRVAAFADFNLLDDRKTSSSSMLRMGNVPRMNVDREDMMKYVSQQDYLNSSTAENAIRQLYAGVKLTVLFSTDVKYGCVVCQGGYPSRRDLRRGSRIQH